MTLKSKKSRTWLSLWLMISSAFLICNYATAQSFDELNQLTDHKVPVYYSSGADYKAKRMAEQLDKVTDFYHERIGFTPAVTLLILSPEDWPKFTTFPVYGMPHYNDKILIVASQNNDFWQSMVPPLNEMPQESVSFIEQTYSDKSGGITMEPFFDLLAIHELGHAYHIQGGLQIQRKWMGELFCNIFLHSYIAENEPQLIDALIAFPRMVVTGTDEENLKYTSLEDLEINYNELGQKYPQNYGWYQCRWHMAAANIYEEGGLIPFQNLWSVLKKQRDILDDQTFATMLSNQVHKSLADVMTNW